MRFVPALLAFAALTAPFTPGLLAPATQLQAQAPPIPSICSGSINVVRISEIKPGMMPKFLEAVAAQQAWYKTVGTPDQISVMRIMQQNSETKVYSFSETEAITTHTQPAARQKGPAHDAGYDAFVAMFKESSTIKTQYITCMAKM